MTNIFPILFLISVLLLVSSIQASDWSSISPVIRDTRPSALEESQADGSLSKLDWKAAGAVVYYPNSWIVSMWGPSQETSSRLVLLSDKETRTRKGYFCIELVINPAAGYRYPLRDGWVREQAQADLDIYQARLAVQGKEFVKVWLTDGAHYSAFQTPTGVWMFAALSYSCVGGDVEYAEVSYARQVESDDFAAGLEILRSIRFVAP